MTQPETIMQDNDRPRGVYFFAQDPIVQRFLARSGNPNELLDELERSTIEDMTQVCHFLKTSILQCRGVEKIHKLMAHENVALENDRRMQFYMAADTKLGQLATQKSE